MIGQLTPTAVCEGFEQFRTLTTVELVKVRTLAAINWGKALVQEDKPQEIINNLILNQCDMIIRERELDEAQPPILTTHEPYEFNNGRPE